MKRLTLKEMTESQRNRVNAKLVQAKKNQDKPLTNSELNRIKEEAIDEIMKELEKEAKAKQTKKKQQSLQISEKTFNWTANNHPRRKR